MQTHHWLMLLVIFIAGVAVQKYFSVWSMVGLPG